MTIEYYLTENDYLQYLLCIASHSQAKKDKKIKLWAIYTYAFVFLSVAFFSLRDKPFGFYFALLALCVQIYYVFYYKIADKKRLKKLTISFFKKRVGLLSTITFTDTDRLMFDEESERKMKLSVIEKITEISNEFFLAFFSGECLTIPKERLENLPEVHTYLQALATERNIPFFQDLQWKW